jgi:hypothetical protein
MKIKSLGLIVASVVLTAVFDGCTTTDQKSAAPESGSVTISDTGGNPHCKWRFTRSASSGKLLKSSLVVTAGAPQCTVQETNTLYIGDAPNDTKEVFEIGAVSFITAGSCRYCYTNTSGGLSCVTYPGPPC